jgi:hypothetical protein
VKIAASVVLVLFIVIQPVPGQTCAGPVTHLSFMAAQQNHVRIPNPGTGALDGFADFTIECWVKISGGGNLDTLVSKWRQLIPGQTPYLLRLYYGVVQFGFSNGFLFNGVTPVNDGAWHHVAVRRIGSTVDILVDGAIDSTTTYAPVVHSMNGPVVLGAFLDGSDNVVASTFLNGELDEVRIWNVGRTLAQIQAGKNQALPGGSLGLVGCWHLDSGSGQTIFDESVTAANGYLGDSTAVAANDPAWSLSGGLALGYPCGSGPGNANSAFASLLVNGVGAAPIAGPFPVTLAAGGTITLSWAGPAGKPVALYAGPGNPANSNFPGIGIVDIGTPPAFADIFPIFDGTLLQNALFFTLGPGGTATQSFTLPPALPAGPFLNVQGIVYQAPGTTPYPIVLTAAFRLSG